MHRFTHKALVLALGLFAFLQSPHSNPLHSLTAWTCETCVQKTICSYASFFFNQQWLRAEGDHQTFWMPMAATLWSF